MSCKTEKDGSKKQKNEKDVEGEEIVESEKGEGEASSRGAAGGGGSGTELMSVKHTHLPQCVDCGLKVLCVSTLAYSVTRVASGIMPHVKRWMIKCIIC